jgi:uncharacterized membrane protein (UPF0136 family)
MSYSIPQADSGYTYHMAKKRKSALYSFLKWASAQDEKNHTAWVGGSITAMAGVLFPITMAIILLQGASFGLIISAMTALVLVVITNLASLPTKYTIPFFVLGVIIDIVTIILSFFVK